MRKKSLKNFWLVNFLIKMEFILRRTKALQINPLQKYTNRLNRKRILPGSNMQVRFDCTSWSSREGVSQTIITTRVHK